MSGEKKTPLHVRLRIKRHREIARLQDILVENIFSACPGAVLHGGTAIWRCYGGNRFSEDVDFYLEKKAGKIDRLFERMKSFGMEVLKKKVGENSLYSVLRFERTEIRCEAVFKKVKGTLRDYEEYDGNLISVYTLTPEELVGEKVDAYLKRRKIRDLYDIFHLVKFVEEKSAVVANLKKLIEEFVTPVDEEDLRALVLFGVVPNYDEIMEYLERWIK